MSQSKMAAAENEKKFVIRHSFENVLKMKEGETMDGPIETYFNIPWKIRISIDVVFTRPFLYVYLDCMVPTKNIEWSIDSHAFGKVVKGNDGCNFKHCPVTFDKETTFECFKYFDWNEVPGLLVDGCFTYEFIVFIKKVTGLDLDVSRSRKFDDDSAREDSDVTLIVGDQKFHVLKKYLGTHSSYFKALFSGNFSDAQKSEIELKDIDPNDFQRFLEFLYAESEVQAQSVLGILHLADFFDSKTVVKRCQKFLMEKSNLPLKQKFEAAVKYNLEELKTKCISEMKTVDDLRQIVPENSKDFDYDVWKELFMKLLSIQK